MSLSSGAPEQLHGAQAALNTIGKPVEQIAWPLLNGVDDNVESVAPLTALKEQTGLQGDEIERLLLWHASRIALPQVPSLPVVPSVLRRLEQDLGQLHSLSGSLEARSYAFNRAAKIATLRRFPAGPMEWEISGIPRSFILQARFPANLRLLSFVTFKLKGWAPCFFMHVAPNPRNRALSIPKEVLRTYYRMAESLKLQPGILGILGHAWFHDPAAVRDSPQLETLNEPFLKEGGLITLLAPAPPASGVLEGNVQRREDYLAGKIQYRYGLAVWPRAAAIRWADTHPELES